MEQRFFTAGEIARISGVTARTIRFYDEKGLLKPVRYSETGYRYYNEQSIERLQKISMLKYLDFSLEQIGEVMGPDDCSDHKDGDIRKSLAVQKKMLLERKDHMERIIYAVELAEESGEDMVWDNLIRIIRLLNREENVVCQYRDDDNLQRRINIHERFDTNPYSWAKWVFDRLHLEENMKILEIGCGNGLLWRENLKRIPKGCTIYLTDFSRGMLKRTESLLKPCESELKQRGITFIYEKQDGNHFNMERSGFDRIIANHMLYHITDREELLRRISVRLSPSGEFFCSTMGKGHMAELHQLMEQSGIQAGFMYDDLYKNFSLENGQGQLKKVFNRVERMDYDCNLAVYEVQALYDYAYSLMGKDECISEKSREKFFTIVNREIQKNGAFSVHKETGMYICSGNIGSCTD